MDPVGARAFRKDFVAPEGKTPVSADIIMTVDNGFTLYVNGAEVGTSGDYRFAERFCVSLKPCLNVFAVNAVNAATVPNPAGLLAAIEITYDDGTTDTIVSDTTWRADTTVPAGFEQLTYDDNSWPAASFVGNYGVAPWGSISIPSDPPVLSLTDANWIWTNEVVNGNAPVGPRAFRRTYVPPNGQTPASATIIITADNEYSLYVNSVLVGSGNDFQIAQRYVVDLLPAPNVVFAVYAVNDLTTPNPAGVIFSAEINMVSECNCTSGAYIISDGAWKSNTATPIGFQLAGYDDSSWPAATVEAPYGSAPWGDVTVSAATVPVVAAKGAPIGLASNATSGA